MSIWKFKTSSFTSCAFDREVVKEQAFELQLFIFLSRLEHKNKICLWTFEMLVPIMCNMSLPKLLSLQTNLSTSTKQLKWTTRTPIESALSFPLKSYINLKLLLLVCEEVSRTQIWKIYRHKNELMEAIMLWLQAFKRAQILALQDNASPRCWKEL